MDTDREIARANQAQRLLDDPLLKECFETLRTDLLTAWEASPARDTEGRENLWRLHKLLGRLEGHLQTIVTGGKVARAELARIEREKNSPRR